MPPSLMKPSLCLTEPELDPRRSQQLGFSTPIHWGGRTKIGQQGNEMCSI